MVELNPAPKETIDLLERIHRLEEEVRQLKDDFSAFAGIQQSSLRLAFVLCEIG